MNLSSKKSTRGALTIVLVLSIGLHLLALFIFGVVKIAQVVMREEVTFEAPPLEPPPEEIPEFEVNLEQRNEESSPPRPNPITVDSPDIVLPALDIDVNVDSYSSYGRGSGGFGNGGGAGGIREMAITATLFGTEVTATKLGVLLDISFSTHKAIDKVLEQVNENFKDAVVVFAPGCVIGDEDTDIYPLKSYERAIKKHKKIGKFSTQPFIEGLFERNKNFAEIWSDLEKQGRGHIAFSEKPNGTTANGGSQDSLEFLRDEGVDTIYWFADFDDTLDQTRTENVLKSMKRGKITLIIHDFVNPLGPSNKRKRESSLQLLNAMADETEGKFFLQTL
ncbi:MAG: hypothetical protein AAF065_13785 [Verrucomicrobiota bacterium]